MISRFNRSQILRAILECSGGVFCLLLAYLFFRYLPPFVMGQFGRPLAAGTSTLIGLAGLGAVFFSGFRVWKSGGGLRGYHESAFYHDLGGETSGAVVADFYAHRITGPAHVLSQTFLSGPILVLGAVSRIARRIPHTPELEDALAATLQAIRLANKWQSPGEYPGEGRYIAYLARMGYIDYSDFKGTPRFKAR